MKTQLHPGARWLFRLRVYSGLLPLLFFFLYFSIAFFRFSAISNGGAGLAGSIIFLIVLIFVFVLFGEVYARMAYNRWFYEFTNTELKIEKGIIWKKFKSIPYERVQNVDIRRGILARIFNFSTVEIETAGYSGFGGARRRNQRYESEGHLPAVPLEAAEKIRDFLMKKISKNHK